VKRQRGKKTKKNLEKKGGKRESKGKMDAEDNKGERALLLKLWYSLKQTES
jgi:hypothetical protein